MERVDGRKLYAYTYSSVWSRLLYSKLVVARPLVEQSSGIMEYAYKDNQSLGYYNLGVE